jgi:hypothetical protein
MRLAAFLLAGCAFAQVEIPTIGMMLDASGALRPVYGVAGTFTLGPAQEGSKASAVLDSGRLVTAYGTVFVDGGELVVRRPDVSEVRFAVSGIVALRAMSKDWVQVMTSGGSYALRVEPGREALFTLPMTARAEVRRR